MDHQKHKPPHGNAIENQKHQNNVFYKFGDVVLKEDVNFSLAEKDRQFYNERFKLFRQLIFSTNDLNEQSFLSTTYIFRSIMGLAPESSYNNQHGTIYCQALNKINALNKFVVLKGEIASIPEIGNAYEVNLIDIQSTERILRNNSDALRLKNHNIHLPPSEIKLSGDQISQYVQLLHNQVDKKEASRAWGLLSGFPLEEVNKYTKNNPANFALKLSPYSKDELNSIMSSKISVGPEYKNFFLKSHYLEPIKTEEEQKNTGTFNGFGVSFKMTPPFSIGVEDLGQKFLAINRTVQAAGFIEGVKNNCKAHS